MTDVIRAECPHCSTQLKIKGQHSIGKKVRCPRCEKPFVVQAPQPDDAAADDGFLNSLDSAVSDASRRQPLASRPRKPIAAEAAPREAPAEKKLRPPKASSGMFAHLGFLGWIVGGTVGGVIGAGIWAAIGYWTGFEVGWLAWGIGCLVGIGVRAAAEENHGVGSGITAVLLAVASVLFGKFLVAWFLVGQFIGEELGPEAIAISEIENEVMADFEKQGRALEDDEDEPRKPAGMNKARTTYKYEEVEAEARRRWNTLDPAKKQAALDKAAENEIEHEAAPRLIAAGVLFIFLLMSPWNLLWLGLAGFTAFKIGSGTGSG